MIQDIGPYRYDNEYKPVPPEKDSFLLCYDGKQVLIKEAEAGIAFPTFGEMEAYCAPEALYQDYTYLFSIDEMRFYLGPERLETTPDGWRWEGTALFRTAEPKYLAFAQITGWQLYQWYKARKYCGRCGHEMVKSEKERMMQCPVCGLTEYPKICPAVIIAVTHGDRLLMSRYAGRDYKRYALLAGFAEIGEPIEETVKREVMEEVGLRVKNLRYYKSQPWSFTDTLLMGFYCELDGDGEDVTLDEEELEMAEWFDRADIPVDYDGISLTNEMIIAFKEGRQ